ncbi:protein MICRORCHIDIA 4-like isoform X2 [Miscanthus floridulus]|uniref:protein MICRORCHIDIA 4-like isoform X2 n=1 Tax=Miscanthus floridulus TaxID=154761 RepID=UPI003458F98E
MTKTSIKRSPECFLLKPFWRVWTAAGSGGRGVIGVLEANFIEPAHDKQDFERTTLLARLEARLVQMQKDYWSGNAHRIGYVAPRSGRNSEAGDGDSPENTASAQPSPYHSGKGYTQAKDMNNNIKKGGKASTSFGIQQRAEKSARTKQSTKSILHGLSDSDNSDSEFMGTLSRSRSHTVNRHQKLFQNGSTGLTTSQSSGLIERERVRTKSEPLRGPALCGCLGKGVSGKPYPRLCNARRPRLEPGTFRSQADPKATSNGDLHTIDEYESVIKQLRDENLSLKERLSKVEESMLQELVVERDKNKSLTERVEDLQRQLESATKEQEALIDIFSEERNRRDQEEEILRKKLKDASSTIQDLLEQLNAARKGRKFEEIN